VRTLADCPIGGIAWTNPSYLQITQPGSSTVTPLYQLRLVLLQLPPSRIGGSWLNVTRMREAYAWKSECMLLHENCISSGSPLCRGLTKAIYIFCIEHLRMWRLSRVSNPGPPALQANTLCKEPLERCINCHRNLDLCCYSVQNNITTGRLILHHEVANDSLGQCLSDQMTRNI
jgi:hypothetical protein